MESPHAVTDLTSTSPRCASIEDVRYAEQLRKEIERRYLARPQQPSNPYWCVAAD
jgi:hypothetical protein